MRESRLVPLLGLLVLCWSAEGRAAPIIAPGAQLEKLAGDFAFTEGPASDAEGNVYFTDQPNDRILVFTVADELRTFLEPAGRSNGLAVDSEGFLWACADEKDQLWRIAPDKGVTVVVDGYQGKRLNGPNDVWIAPDGSVYFTDPYYQRPYWQRTEMEQDRQAVYRLSPDHQELQRVIEDLVQPNGIIGTPDGQRLYVADIGARRTYSYAIAADGRLGERTLFCEMGSDGLTLDDQDNLYLTGRGVTVFCPSGEKIEQIDVPEPWTANVCFGGRDHQSLFITASKGLYRLRMSVKGVGSQ
jgi:gluconolactonase